MQSLTCVPIDARHTARVDQCDTPTFACRNAAPIRWRGSAIRSTTICQRSGNAASENVASMCRERAPSIPSFVAPLDDEPLCTVARPRSRTRTRPVAGGVDRSTIAPSPLPASEGRSTTDCPIAGFPLAAPRHLPGQSRRPVSWSGAKPGRCGSVLRLDVQDAPRMR
jgi:hypothetical protein